MKASGAGLLLSVCLLCSLAAAASPAKKAAPPPPNVGRRRGAAGTALEALLQDSRLSKFTAALMVGGCAKGERSSSLLCPAPQANTPNPAPACLQNTGLSARLSKASFVATVLAPTGGWSTAPRGPAVAVEISAEGRPQMQRDAASASAPLCVQMRPLTLRSRHTA